MTKIITIALAAVATFASTASLVHAEEGRFKRDGYTYVYSVIETGTTRQISGKYYPGGRSFALDVRNGRVEGRMHESSVSFPLSAVKVSASGALASAE